LLITSGHADEHSFETTFSLKFRVSLDSSMEFESLILSH